MAPRTTHQLLITLRDVEPSVWRRLTVPSGFTLAQLHAAVQTSMGWTDSHLHEFEVNRERYGAVSRESASIQPPKDERRVRLQQVAGEGEVIAYWYDFGDDWFHDIVVEQVRLARAGESVVQCIDGAGACPPEDVGGPPGYEEFREALADPEHPDHEHVQDWWGGPFDPVAFDRDRINDALRELARLRR